MRLASRFSPHRWLLAAFFAVGAWLPAAAQQAGVEPILVRPDNLAPRPAMTPQQIARMLEVPTYARRLGAPSVRYSYGEFLLLDRQRIPASRAGSGPAGQMPSDQHHSGVNPVNLDWSPTQFDHCLDLMTPVRDQGGRGTCHVMAATALVESLLKRRSRTQGAAVQVGATTERIVEEFDLSEQWLQFRVKQKHHAGNNESCVDDGNCNDDLQSVRDDGHVPEVFWRYNPTHWYHDSAHSSMVTGTTADGPWNWKVVAQTENGQPPASVTEAIDRRGSNPAGLRAFRVRDVTGLGGHETGVDAIRDQVVNRGLPVTILFAWPTRRMIANGCVLYVPDSVKDKSEDWCWNDTETVGGKTESKWLRGGHCVLVMGAGKAGTAAEGLFAFKNSWSGHWGREGYGYVSEAYLKKFLWGVDTCALAEGG